jgi:hypothetical protein
MLFHAELFSSSIAQNGYNQVTFFSSDAILQILNNGMQVSANLPYLMAVFGVSAHLESVRMQSPSMLPFPYINISPSNRGTVFESPPRHLDLSHSPLPLKMTEELDCFAYQNGSASESVYVLALFCDGTAPTPPPAINPATIVGMPLSPGRMFTVHGTASTTLTAGAWTQITPTLDQALPAGQYALIGARVYSATALFFRMYPQLAPQWRPGGVAVQAYDQLDPPYQRAMNQWSGKHGLGWGTWLTFYQNTVPKVEIFATAADTAEETWFDLVWLGGTTTQGM